MKRETQTRIWRGELPHSVEAERALIGSTLVLAAIPPDVVLPPGDFYHPVNQAIWQAVLALDASGQRPDPIAVGAYLESKGEGPKLTAMGQGYLADVMGEAVVPEIAPHHARIIAEAAQKRRVIAAASSIPSVAVAGEDGWQAETERLLLEATDTRRESKTAGLRQILGTVSTLLETRYKARRPVTGIPSGFACLDGMTSGWQPSELIIIAARPSMGKTALAMNAATHAVSQGLPVLVFSLEMSKESLVERMIASESQTSLASMRSGMMTQRDWIAVTNCMSRLSGVPLWIDDDGDTGIASLRRKARRWAALPEVQKAGHGLIVVDYLQLMSTDGIKADTRDREVAAISRGLKALARELRVPLMALSQLNRSCESRSDKRPTLADLRDSGAIEQDADVIAFIYRDEVYNPKTADKGRAEVMVAKQRNGPTGKVFLGWDAQFTRFYESEARA